MHGTHNASRFIVAREIELDDRDEFRFIATASKDGVFLSLEAIYCFPSSETSFTGSFATVGSVCASGSCVCLAQRQH